MQYLTEIFNNLEAIARTTGDQVFASLLPGANSLFKIFFFAWLVWNIGYRGLVKYDLNLKFFIKAFLVTTTISLFLSTPNFYKEWIYHPFYETSAKLLQTVLKSSSFNGHPATIQGVLGAIEEELEKVIQLTNAVRQDSAFYRLDHSLMALILRLAFEFLGLLYLSFATEFVFGLMFVTALFPLIAVCLGFERTRGMGILALKIPVHGALTLVVGSLALSFLFTTIHSSVGAMPIDGSGIKAGAADWTYTKGYDSLMIIVFLGAMFLMKSAQYAASFLHINVGVGANAAMASAGTATLQYTKMKGTNVTKNISAGAKKIIERMKELD